MPDVPTIPPDTRASLFSRHTDPRLERRGRSWLIWSFLLCPCHLPLSLGVLATVFAGTSLGALLREHVWLAGSVLTVTWVLGTGYGLHLIRRAQRAGGACPLPDRPES